VTVDKDPRDPTRFRRERRFTASGRAAFAHLLAHLPRDRGRVLLPAYIGLSPREGSGVYDPVVGAGVPHAFYRVGPDLCADVAHVAALLAEAPAAAVLVIHYFGAAEPALTRIGELAHAHGAVVVEDCAHAIGATADGTPLGDVGDYAVFAIHKLIAAPTGGFLQLNRADVAIGEPPPALAIEPEVLARFHATRWPEVAAARIANYRGLAARVGTIPGVRLFWPELPVGCVPHTLPVLIERADRFAVYGRMRDAGLGVVALYHTLIPPITAGAFPDAHAVSARILNLPIHHEVTPGGLDRLAEGLAGAVRTA